MRVEIRTQKAVPHIMPSGEGRSNNLYQVFISSKAGDVMIASFSTPGSFTDGFLSETQAKVRAKETADRVKNFLALQGQLDAEMSEPVLKAPRKPGGGTQGNYSRFAEERSFLPRTA